MEIKYGCVNLRAVELEDLSLLKLLINSSNVENMTVGWNVPISSYNQEKWIKNWSNSSQCFRWMIELENGITLGMITMTNIDWKNRVCLLSYKSNPMEINRMKGDMKDAVYAVLRYVFDELNLHRVDASILDYNVFSLKLCKSMGFVEEGKYRNRIFKNGKWHDEICLGLLEEEFVRYEDGHAPWQKNKRE